MYCILVTGIPAAGKSTMAETLAENLKLPVISKDTIKELLFDCVGFRSREEKVNQVDTTDFSKINLGEIMSQIDKIILIDAVGGNMVS